jgi:hypothetical protein
MQIGLADARERERLLTLGQEGPHVPCTITLPVVAVRTTDSSNIAPRR